MNAQIATGSFHRVRVIRIALLLALSLAAARQPGLAKQPAPQVYVVNFSAGAMTFQLRAWTDRYEDWAQLRSDLAVALNEALIREKIAIA